MSTIQCRVTHPATCFMASTCFIQLPSTNPGMFKQKYTNWAIYTFIINLYTYLFVTVKMISNIYYILQVLKIRLSLRLPARCQPTEMMFFAGAHPHRQSHTHKALCLRWCLPLNCRNMLHCLLADIGCLALHVY